jgi:hypothetical protein
LIRASINLQKSLAKQMDCRVKPGNDGCRVGKGASRAVPTILGEMVGTPTGPRIRAIRWLCPPYGSAVVGSESDFFTDVE